MESIAQGAEAVLSKDRGTIVKERVSKTYRLPQLDESLRKFRTRREAKILGRLEEMNFPAPHLKEWSDQRMSLVMDFIPGETMRDVLKQGDVSLVREMGRQIGTLHTKNIVHGDLTTSNMIKHNGVSFIDFGLSSFSEKVEDKAVDLFLLQRALESTHYELPSLFNEVMEGYKERNPDAVAVLERLKEVQKRGRNKERQ